MMKILLLFLCLQIFGVFEWRVTCNEELLENRVKALEKLLEETRKKLTEAKAKLATLKTKNEKRAVGSIDEGTPILFTAQLKTHLDNLGDNHPIIYDTVLINEASGYDSVTGVFTVPVDGNYLFAVTQMCSFRKWIETRLIVNGVSEMRGYAGSSLRFNQATTVVSLQLKAGDKVWVETFNNVIQGNHIVKLYGDSWSAFSGVRVPYSV